MRYHSSMQREPQATDSGFAESKDGTRIHWSVTGSGAPALVCCDGIGCVGFDDISSDLQAVLEATRTEQAVLLGHSMGVQVALEHHRRRPDPVLALVLMCGSHGLPLDTFHDTKALKIILPSMIAAAEKYPQAMDLIWRLTAGGELAYQLATHLEVNGKLVRREDFLPYFRHLAGMDPRLFLGMLKNASEHTAYDH